MMCDMYFERENLDSPLLSWSTRVNVLLIAAGSRPETCGKRDASQHHSPRHLDSVQPSHRISVCLPTVQRRTGSGEEDKVIT